MSGIPGAFGGGSPAGTEEQQLIDQVSRHFCNIHIQFECENYFVLFYFFRLKEMLKLILTRLSVNSGQLNIQLKLLLEPTI